MRARISVLAASLAAGWASGAAADDPLFAIQSIASPGRTVAAELGDLNGDGRADLFTVSFQGFPPDEHRSVRVFFQRADGAFPDEPDRTWTLPAGSAAYDLADVLPRPGLELLLLHLRGVHVVSLAGPEPEVLDLRVPGVTLATSQDERGMDRMRIAWTGLGDPAGPGADEPWLLLPMPREVVALAPSGEVRARLRVGTRANYLVPPRPGPLLVESEIQVFLDVPVLAAGEVNGDGRVDLVAASRHDLRVFLRREDGNFGVEPDRVDPLGRLTPEDHLRGSGTVRVELVDLDRDGLLDAVVSTVAGGLTDARTETAIHLNRGGTWDFSAPDQRFLSTGAYTADQLIDIDGDGTRELLRVRIPVTVFEVVEVLVTRAVDVQALIHRPRPGGGFDEEPWIERKIDLPISFETGRPRGFIPTVHADLNGDGHLDLMSSGGGENVEVFLGGPSHRFERRHGRQPLATQGRVRFGDLDADGLADFVLYAPRQLDAPLRVARNLGTLPGSPPRALPAEVAAPSGP